MEANNDAATPAEASSDWDGTYTWRVENWTRKKEKKLYSPDFEIGGYTWRLLVFPRGIDNQRTSDYIGVYLDFSEGSFTPPQLCPKARFQLMAVKINTPEDSLRREATHTFTTQAADWGFTQFLPVQEAQHPQNGFLVDDALTLSVSIRIEREDHLSRMSRRETGFVGLENKGATDPLNTVLQNLFHIKCFRKAVYQMPALESDNPEKSATLAFQSLFYKLQYQKSSVDTKDLTKSSEWGTFDCDNEHDIQQMLVLLLGILEEKMRGTSLETCIPELFKGQYSVYVECLHVDHTAMSHQPYMEIELDVLGCKDVYDSLEKLCGVEILEGANRYKSEEHGLVDAKRYALFDSFPPVLHLHLMRFDYDPTHDAFFKVNSRYKFYDELDLDYNNHFLLSKIADKSIENKYKLYSVLVHDGDGHGGRNFAFVKPDEKWYRFDDELVQEVSAKKAIDDQFGNEDGTTIATSERRVGYTKQSSAYMLVYIRKSDWARIMCEVSKEDISEPIRRRLELEQQEKEKRQREKKEAHLYVVIKLASERHLVEQLGNSHYFDLANFDNVKNYRIYKGTPFEEFKEMVSKDFGIPEHHQRFWLWDQRPNCTIRVSKPLNDSGIDISTVLDLRCFRDKSSSPDQDKTALMTIKLFLESPEQAFVTRDTLRPIQRNELLIFLKYYDPELSRLSYLGHVFVEKSCQFRVIFEKAKKMAGLGPEEEVIGFEEVKYLPVVICSDLSPNTTPEKAQLIQGDIVIIQKLVNNIHYEYPTVRSFLEFINTM